MPEALAAAMTPDDRRDFAERLQRHRGIVVKIAHSYAWDADDRDDLCQEIAAQLWRAWPAYDPARSFSTWMYRIARNVAISHVRNSTQRSRHMVALDEDLHDIADDGGRNPEQEQQLRALQRVIAGLDKLNRALLLLYLEERSNRDIGEILGLSESNVSTKISRLKQRIRDEFA